MAFLSAPKVLFLEEPTASLDPDIADKTRALIKEVRRSTGLTVLYTSHNMREMEEMSDRIIFLQRGRIVAEGRAAAIKAVYGETDLEDVLLKLARTPPPGVKHPCNSISSPRCCDATSTSPS